MRWRKDWSERPPRPKVRRLSANEQQQLQAEMAKEIARSPVLSGFGVPVRGIIVTSRSADRKFDFVSRFFAPASGVDEDPVTGSAQCCLGAFWQKRLHKS